MPSDDEPSTTASSGDGSEESGTDTSSGIVQSTPSGATHLTFPEEAGDPDHVPPGALIGDSLDDIQEMVEEYVGMWGEFDPDYTVESITGIDEMFATQQERANYLQIELDDGRTGAFAPMAVQPACYFGEVMIRNYDAEWVKDPDYGWALGFKNEHIVNLFGTVHRALEAEPPFVHMHDTFVDNYDLDGAPLDPDGDRLAEVRQSPEPDQAEFDDVDRDEAATQESTPEQMQDFADDFVTTHSEYDLDYSEASLDVMDTVIDEKFRTEAFADAELGATDDEHSIMLTAATTEAGSYFGEVVRQTTGGEWKHREDDGLKIEFPIEGAEVRIDPFGMAGAVVADGESFRDQYDEILATIEAVEEELPGE